MRLKVLIADDEPLAREGLKRLAGADPRVEAIWEARNGRETVTAIREHKPHLVFLDIQMPRMDGFDVVEAVVAIAHWLEEQLERPLPGALSRPGCSLAGV